MGMAKDCPKCDGMGTIPGAVKPDANGTLRQTTEPCPMCNGSGEVPNTDTRPMEVRR